MHEVGARTAEPHATRHMPTAAPNSAVLEFTSAASPPPPQRQPRLYLAPANRVPQEPPHLVPVLERWEEGTWKARGGDAV